MDTDDCGRETMMAWAHDARDWALRSQVDPRNVGYMCWDNDWRFVKVRDHR
jgi:hypothetical protein